MSKFNPLDHPTWDAAMHGEWANAMDCMRGWPWSRALKRVTDADPSRTHWVPLVHARNTRAQGGEG